MQRKLTEDEKETLAYICGILIRKLISNKISHKIFEINKIITIVDQPFISFASNVILNSKYTIAESLL